jgi:hypothetical protein
MPHPELLSQTVVADYCRQPDGQAIIRTDLDQKSQVDCGRAEEDDGEGKGAGDLSF